MCRDAKTEADAEVDIDVEMKAMRIQKQKRLHVAGVFRDDGESIHPGRGRITLRQRE